MAVNQVENIKEEELYQADEITDYDDFFINPFSLDGFDDETHEYLDDNITSPMKGQEQETPIVAPLSPEPVLLVENVKQDGDGPGVPQTPRAHMPLPQSPAMAVPTPMKGGATKKGKKRGSYNCGKCGLPKKGHVCVDTSSPDTPAKMDFSPHKNATHTPSHTLSPSYAMRGRILHRSSASPSLNKDPHGNDTGNNNKNNNGSNCNVVAIPHGTPMGCSGSMYTPQRNSFHRAKRSLSMTDGVRSSDLIGSNVPKAKHSRGASLSSPTSSYSSNDRHGRLPECHADMNIDMDSVDSTHLSDRRGTSVLTATCMLEVLKRLPPSSLLAASNVCTLWRRYVHSVWSAVEETRLLVSHHRKGSVFIILQKCPNLKHLILDVKSEIDDDLLRTIANLTPCLASLEIQISQGGINSVTGDGLNYFISTSISIQTFKLENCKDIRNLNIRSAHLGTLWLADCYSMMTMVIDCPSLTELSLTFAPEEDDSTDLCNLIENLGQGCPRLSKLHIASPRLKHSVVLALASANFRFLHMLSLTFGLEITDASVVSLASSFNNLQLLDLSGSSITDRGLGIICNAFSGTLSKLLIALCPNISVAGLQMVAMQLPFLQLLDCGMTISDKCYSNGNEDINHVEEQAEFRAWQSLQKQNLHSKEHTVTNELVLKHLRLKKLSLWGCSGIHALYLDCPELVDLNIKACGNLNPEKMSLQCPALQVVHAAYCNEVLVNAVQSKVDCCFQRETLHFSTKRMADGSKRVQAPCFGITEPCEDQNLVKKDNAPQHLRCLVHTT